MTFQYDPTDIKSHLDGQGLDLAERYFGAGKRSGRAVQYVNPTVHQKTGSFTVYPDGGFKDHKLGDAGDVFGLIALGEGLDIRTDFPRILEIAAGIAGVGPLPADQPRRAAAPRPRIVPTPPGASWQSIALDELKRAQSGLWSEAGRAALDYLREVRGLTDKMIRDAGLGFNAQWRQTSHVKEDGRPAYLPPGIVIPWFIDGQLWALRVRTPVGNLAQALGVPDALNRKGQPLDKYLSFSGSKLGGALYGADDLITGRAVLFVEGEFDALVARQTLVTHSVVTLGSASSRLDSRWQDAIAQTGAAVTLMLDADDAGQAGQAALITALTGRVALSVVAVPAGKDTTDFVRAGGDLGALLNEAVPIVAPKPVIWPAELPFQLERAIMTFTKSTGTCILLRIVCAAAAAGLDVDGAGFTVADLVEHAAQVGVSRKQLYSALDETNPMATVLFQNETQYLTREESSLLKESTMSHSGTIAEPSRSSGRQAARYVRRPYVGMVRLFLDRVVAPRAIEQHFPDPAQAPITPELLTALGADSTQLDALKARLTDAGLTIDQVVRNAALRVYRDWQRWLRDESPAPMPDGEAWGTVAGYKAAIVRRSALEAAGSGKSIAATVKETGLSKSAVLRVSAQAGVMREQQLFSRELAPGKFPAPGYDREAEGFARQVTVTDVSGAIRLLDIDAPNIRVIVASERKNGATIEVIYQGASIPRALEGEERVRFTETQSRRRANRARVEPELKAQQATELKAQQATDKPRRTPFLGVGHDPEYARRWLAAMLTLVGYQWRSDCGDVIDRTTGQIISAPTHDMLLGLILHGEALASQPGDCPDAFRLLAAETGGLLKALTA